MADSRNADERSRVLRQQVMGQVRALRKRIDPRLLERVRAAVYGTDGLPTAAVARGAGPAASEKAASEKDSARAAVAAFLDGLADNGAFRRALDRELRQEGRRLDDLLPVDPPPLQGKADQGKAAVLLSAPLPDEATVAKAAVKTPAKTSAKTPIKAKKKFWPFF